MHVDRKFSDKLPTAHVPHFYSYPLLAFTFFSLTAAPAAHDIHAACSHKKFTKLKRCIAQSCAFSPLKNLAEKLFPSIAQFDLKNPEELSKAEQTLFEKACKKIGLNSKDISVKKYADLETNHQTVGLTVGQSLILLDKKLFSFSKQEQLFIIGHELAHIKNKDWLKKIIVAGTTPLICCQTLHHLARKIHAINTLRPAIKHPVLMTTSYAMARYISLKVVNAYSRYRETAADLTAAEKLDSAAGGIALFSRLIKANLTYRNDLLKNKKSSKETGVDKAGNNIDDVEHPPLTQRIAALCALQKPVS